MSSIKNKKAFSLIELVIAMAISLLLIGVLGGIYSLRRQTANDNAAQQILSQIDLVRNEAQRGASGYTQPPGSVNNPDTLYGQAVMFDNTCFGAGKACMAVSKLRQSTSSPADLVGYDAKTIDLPEGFKFMFDTTQTPVSLYNTVFPSSSCLGSSSCGFTAKPGNTYANCNPGWMMYLTCPPVSAIGANLPVLFIPNPSVSKKMALLAIEPVSNTFPKSTFDSALGSTSGQTGLLQLFIASSDNTAQYLISIDMSGSNTTVLTKVK